MGRKRFWAASGMPTVVESDDDALEIEGLDVVVTDLADSKGITSAASVPSKFIGEPVIVAKDIFKVFDLPGRKGEKIKAFESVSLSSESRFKPIRRGEFVMIRGPSGGGKSTLLNIFGTLTRPSGGQLRLFNQNMLTMPEHSLPNIRLRKIGFVFQTFNLLAAQSAFENVELPMVLLGELKRSERIQRATTLLKEVGLGDRLEHLPSELSGGEQQRVAIARALANEPELLLLDEPTGDLSSADTCEIMDVLLRVNIERGATCVMVTHNGDLECYADRVLYLEDGRFSRQRFNSRQKKVDAAQYAAYLTSVEQNALEDEITPA